MHGCIFQFSFGSAQFQVPILAVAVKGGSGGYGKLCALYLLTMSGLREFVDDRDVL